MDFTIKQYQKLISSLQLKQYVFHTMEEFIQNPSMEKMVVLRHDVDERPHNALKLAQVEYEMGIKATYYFRIVRISNDASIITAIAKMGHEIGYHYEDYALSNGDLSIAINSFKKNLNYFRKFYPVKTVCMHGSSMSEYDNRIMWDHYKLSDFDIIGEPYLSIDYTKVLYLTDTGRCWDGGKYSVRDYVNSDLGFSFHKSTDIIMAVNNNELPNQIVLQSHTLWTDSMKEWIWLRFREKFRNKIKMIVFKTPWIKNLAYKLIKLYSN